MTSGGSDNQSGMEINARSSAMPLEGNVPGLLQPDPVTPKLPEGGTVADDVSQTTNDVPPVTGTAEIPDVAAPAGIPPAWAHTLKQLYDDVVSEPIPESFEALLRKLDGDTK